MPVHLLTENDFQAMEQELAEVLEAWGADPDYTANPEYMGSRAQDNASLRRYGINGDVNLSQSVFEYYEMAQRAKSLAQFLPQENREKALKLLEWSERMAKESGRLDNLNYGWSSLSMISTRDGGGEDPQLEDQISQKNEEISQMAAPYRAFFDIMTRLYGTAVNYAYNASTWNEVQNDVGADIRETVNDILSQEGLTLDDAFQVFKEMAEKRSILGSARGSEDLSAAVMDVQEYTPGEISPFLLHEASARRLTTAQKGFAVQNFDRAFEFIFPPQMREEMTRNGRDVFDYILIDGQSANERWEREYEGESYEHAAEQMKCRFMEAALSAQPIQVLVPSEQGIKTIPFEVTSSQERIREAVLDAASRRPSLSAGDIAAASQYQDRMEHMDAGQREKKRLRMREQHMTYPDMDSVLPETVDHDAYVIRGAGNGDERAKAYARAYRLGTLNGQLSSAELEEEDRKRMVKAGSDLLGNLTANDPELDVRPSSNPIYRTMGIEDYSQLFFIDGKPAFEYVESAAGRSLSPGSREDQMLVQAEIAAAFLSAEHRVEMAKVGMDEYGNFQVGVVSLQHGLESLDGQEKWYQRKPSKKAESFYRKDEGRQQRVSDIRSYMGEKLVAAETRRLRLEEDPFVKARNRFTLTIGGKLSGVEKTLSYFGKENLERLVAMEDELPPDLHRGGNHEMGGCRTLAYFLTMADNPQIRFADLTDEDKYMDQKKAAAQKLTDALAIYYAPDPGKEPNPVPLAEIIVSCMKTVENMDLGREILYAMGAPENGGPQKLREVMDEHSPEVTELLNVISGAAQNFMQATDFSGLRDSKRIIELRDDSLDIEREIIGRLSQEERERYVNGSEFLISGLTPEREFSAEARNYRSDPNVVNDLSGKAALREVERDLIAKGVIAGEVPTSVSQTIRTANDMSQSLQEKFQKQFPHDAKTEKQNVFNNLYGRGIKGENIRREGMAYLAEAEKNVYSSRMISPQRFFDRRGNLDQEFESLEHSTGIKGLARQASRASLIRLFMLTNDDVSLGDLLNPAKSDLRMAGGELFEEGLKNLPVEGVSGDERKESLRYYGWMFAKSADKLLKEQVPKIDWGDPYQCMFQMERMKVIKGLMIDHNQGLEPLKKKYPEEFLKNYRLDMQDGAADAAEGEKLYLSQTENMETMQYFSDFLEQAMNPTLPLENRTAAKLVVDRVGEIIGGAKIGELASLVTQQEMLVLHTSALKVAMEQSLDPKKMEDYLNGTAKESPIPADILDLEVKNQTKAQERALARRKVSFGDVQAKENRTQPGQGTPQRRPQRQAQQDGPQVKSQPPLTH